VANRLAVVPSKGRELPPPRLDSGIAAAFRELAERAPIPVVVDADVERLDRSLETTAYFVGCEGLTNVIKHVRADRVAAVDGRLHIESGTQGPVRPGSVGTRRTQGGCMMPHIPRTPTGPGASACMIAAHDNHVQGGPHAGLVRNNRLLDGDSFWVALID
jgi:hypothetical protein